MKRFIVFCSILFCGVAVAQQITINWLNEDGTNITTSTCTVGDDLLLPNNIPQEQGYAFRGFVDNYTPVQYIESDGNQVIDPDWTATQNTGVRAKIYIVSAAAYDGFFGALNTSTKNFLCGLNVSKKLSCMFGGNTVTSSVVVAAGDIVELDWNKRALVYSINGTKYYGSFGNYYLPNAAMSLFSVRLVAAAGGGVRFDKKPEIRLYYFQIYNSGVLVRDFIPVTDGTGTPCLYERVEGKFYYNSGSGDFVAGPVV